MCALCGKPIARYGTLVCAQPLSKGNCWPDMRGCTHRKGRVKFRHPLSWSLDHIIPAAEAPELRMQRGNLREAHYGCNAARKDGVPQGRGNGASGTTPPRVY